MEKKKTVKMRLDRFLSSMGMGSRKEITDQIKRGAVTLNGKVCKQGKQQINALEDEVCMGGQRVVYEEMVYLMLNKPPGVISATEDPRHQTVIDLIHKPYCNRKIFPVGRLDKDTEGLLLLTDDGHLAHQLLSPKKDVFKKYFAQINSHVNEEDVESFSLGITLDDGYCCKSAKLVILKASDDFSEVEVYISEGKFHQVKRMFEALGKEVTYLKRLSMGNLLLDENLKMGDYRPLTTDELNALKSMT